MNKILSTLADVARDPFTWDANAANPLAALTGVGLDPASANEVLSVLRRETIHSGDGSWQSCDACIDPSSDPDPF